MDRRQFSAVLLRNIGLALFAQQVFAERLLARRASRGVRAWVAAHHEIAAQLAKGRTTGLQWQNEVARLARAVDVTELVEQIDFAKVERTMDLRQPGGTKHVVRLEHPDDPSRQLSFGAAVFGLRHKHSITPHAHRNMVSAHMLLKGQMRVRNFDRVAAEPGYVIVEPTVDATIRPGDISTMSTERNNVHWFTALSPAAFTLDVIVDGLNPRDRRFVIELLDVNNAERVPGGRRRARIIDWKESIRLYGIER